MCAHPHPREHVVDRALAILEGGRLCDPAKFGMRHTPYSLDVPLADADDPISGCQAVHREARTFARVVAVLQVAVCRPEVLVVEAAVIDDEAVGVEFVYPDIAGFVPVVVRPAGPGQVDVVTADG